MAFAYPPFSDRAEAGRQLAERLGRRALHDVVVYALPRGGVPVGLEIASALKAPLDLVLVRKIGAPGNPELALAAVVEGDPPGLVINDSVRRATGASEDWLAAAEERELAEIARRRRLYLGERPRSDPGGRTAIVVDDGLATGATARAAVQALRAQGAGRVILAVPVAPSDTAAEIRPEVDELVCLVEAEHFGGVGAFYSNFHQLTDDEVVDLLSRSRLSGTVPPTSAPGASA